MTEAALGTKRKCLSCAAAFFDLQHDPIVCPRCKATFTPIPIPRTVAYKMKTRLPAEPARVKQPEAMVEDEAEVEQDDENSEISADDDPDRVESEEEPDDDVLPLE